ncbi:PAS domain S-box-containing protein [Desulfobacula phenolica]|uniref:histidine kinase n=1 Tax=Desulfobacula phenolica TaxID=90732 RepID=A0A1H2HW24_9BACT|nr:PAS domain S-box-containing protein [Desulfobacula phenolica]
MDVMSALFKCLAPNILLFFSFSFLFGFLRSHFQSTIPIFQNMAMGALFAVVAGIGVMTYIDILPVILMDGRVILVGLAAAYGGITFGICAGALVSEKLQKTVKKTASKGLEHKKNLSNASPKFFKIFHKSPICMGITTIDEGKFIDVNENFIRITGYTREETIGTTSSDLGFISVDDRNHLKQLLTTQGEVNALEVVFHKKDGSIFYGLYSGVIITFEGKPQLLSITEDITKRKLAELELIKKQKNEQELRIRLEALWKIASMGNETLKTICDYALAEIENITHSPYAYIGFLNHDESEMTLYSISPEVMIECNVTDNPIKFPVKTAGFWSKSIKKKAPLIINDYAAKHEEKSGLPEGHVRIKRFLSVPTVGKDGIELITVVANKPDEYTKEDVKQIEALITNVMILIHQKKAEHERKELEKQLQQLQKVEAIGSLAGGIAHDFNNILFPIIGYAEMLVEDFPQDSQYKESVNEILIGARRAKDLVKQILTFSRQTDQKVRPLKPDLIIKEVIKLIRSTIPTSIKIKKEIDPDCLMILADPTQIHQVAMNLITNAYHAIQDSRGTLTIKLKNSEKTDLFHEKFIPCGKPFVEPFIWLSVSDTGTGMDKMTLEKIFDPYFTTKSKGKGTGIGLSVVQGIVKSCKGEIKVTSSPGEGSTFDVYIPALKQRFISDPQAEKLIHARGNERILLVDDEHQVLRLEKTMLERLGYKVETQDSSLKAVELISANPDRFDLVITDMTMPDMTGDLLAHKIMDTIPGFPVIICTGFSEQISPEKARSIGVKGLLFKPIIKSKFTETIRSVLDESK